MNQNILINKLNKLAKMTLSSPHFYNSVVELTFTAFYNKKPLFKKEEKPAAAKLIEKSFPLINEAYTLFHGGMIPDLRQNAQISRSGLQYLIDDFKENEEIYKKLKPIFNLAGVRLIEQSIESHTGIPPEYWDLPEIDLTQIPPSHFWWFFVDDDE